MKRRAFLGTLGAASVSAAWMPGVAASEQAGKREAPVGADVRLAGMSLPELRTSFKPNCSKCNCPSGRSTDLITSTAESCAAWITTED